MKVTSIPETHRAY